jgi:hypothetical protein
MPVGLVAAGVGAAGAIGGAIISSDATKSAAKTSAAAADRSLAVQQQEFNQTTANNKPFLTTGTSALNQLAGLYGLDTVDASGNVMKGSGQGDLTGNETFYQTPDYQFAFDQGIKGIDAGAAARGMLDSGATRKAEARYASNLASGTFNSYADRLRQLAGIGQSAANAQSQAGANFASGYTNTVTGAAADQANATLTNASNINNSINQLIGAARYGLGKNPFGSSYGQPNPTGAVGGGFGGTNQNGMGVLY